MAAALQGRAAAIIPAVTPPPIPPEYDDHRDAHWRREATRSVESVFEAERFIEQVGFAACLTDSRRPGPSLYVAVCGRRDAVMPRNVQKDPEASLTWTLKDEIMGRGKVYYAKLARGKSMFLAPRMVPHFNAIWGVRKADEARRLSRPARAVLKVLRGEWEMATADLRAESGVKDRATFTRAMDELQAAMIVIPEAAYYLPKFTYIWTLGIARFPDELRKRVQPRRRAPRDRALLPRGRGPDGSRRARARHRLVAARCRTWQSRAREGRLRRLALAWRVPSGRGPRRLGGISPRSHGEHGEF